MTDSDDTTTIPTVQPPPSSVPPPPPSYAPPPPAWRPPRDERRRDVSLVFGVILLLIGLWFFASRTLGLTLPRLELSQLWPILLIGLGVWIVLGAFRRPR